MKGWVHQPHPEFVAKDPYPLEKAEEQGTFFGLVTVVMVAGRKP